MSGTQDKKPTQQFCPFEKTETGLAQVFCSGEMLKEAQAALLRDIIPLNPLATPEMIASLKHETEPMDLIFSVDYKESKSGTEYADSAYEAIVNKIVSSPIFVPAGYGHQSQEAFFYEGRELYGSVIGALLDKEKGKVFYRIIPDKGIYAEKIRRWLKNKQINAVSIWGIPTYADSSRRLVIDYDLRSVDFVPPFSEGQKNEIAIGQMDSKSHNEKEAVLRIAVEKKYEDWIWLSETYDTFTIAEYKNELYKIPYTMDGEKAVLGDAVKVIRIVTYKETEVEDMENITNDALLAELKKRTADGRISPERAAGEMGVRLEDTEKMKVLESSKHELETLCKAAGEMGMKLDEALEFTKISKEEKEKAEKTKAFGEMVEKVKTEKGLLKDGKPTGEMASLVEKFARFETGMSREQVAGEMDRVINDPDIQKLVGNKAPDAVGEMGGSGLNSGVTVVEI